MANNNSSYNPLDNWDSRHPRMSAVLGCVMLVVVAVALAML